MEKILGPSERRLIMNAFLAPLPANTPPCSTGHVILC